MLEVGLLSPLDERASSGSEPALLGTSTRVCDDALLLFLSEVTAGGFDPRVKELGVACDDVRASDGELDCSGTRLVLNKSSLAAFL